MKSISTYLIFQFFIFHAVTAGQIRFLSPLDNSILYSNDEIDIAWNAKGALLKLDIEFSIDSGVTWNEIATDINSTLGLIKWRVPFFDNVKCFIRLSPIKERTKNSFREVLIKKENLAETYYQWKKVVVKTPFFNRDGAGAVVFKNKVWLLGGWHYDSIPRTNNEVWTSPDGINWTYVGKAPWERRHTAGYLVLKEKMYVLGGDVNSNHYQNDVWATSDGNSWEKIKDSVEWAPRVLFNSFTFRNKLWILGGQTLDLNLAPDSSEYFNDVWSSSDGKVWKRVQANSSWNPRGMMIGSPVFNGRMWIVGGGTYKTQFFNDVWSSSDGENWITESKNNSWKERTYHSVNVFDNKIFILGGYNGDNIGDAYYSDNGKEWTALTDIPWSPRHAASVYVFNNSLFITGGPLYEENAIYELVKGVRSIKLNFSGEISIPHRKSILIRTEFVLGAKYKWYRDGQFLDGQITNRLSIDQSGSYSCEIISKLGEILSSNVLICKK